MRVKKSHKLALFSLAAMLLLTAAGTLARLTVDNQSDKAAALTLTGPGYYYLNTPAGTTIDWTPVKGVYSFKLFSCGVYSYGTLDLTKNAKIIVPKCGLKAGGAGKAANTIDAGQLIKLVRIKLTNGADSTLTLILDGVGADYVFTLYAGKSYEYTIPKGFYDYTLYGCGRVGFGAFEAYAHRTKTWECP